MFTSIMDSFFPHLKEKHIKPAWEFNGKALIWRIFFTANNKIVGETRNQNTKKASFFCVNADSGKPFWNDIGLDEPWWIGIEAIHDRWIILHGFARPDMPEHRGIWLLNIENGSLAWENKNLTFWFFHSGKLYANKYLFEKRIGYELDIKTGDVIAEYSDNLDVLHELKHSVLEQEYEPQQGITLPEVFENDQYESSIGAIVRKLTGGKELEGWIEYLTQKEILVLSYYQKESIAGRVLLNNFLAIYNMQKETTIYKKAIIKGIQAPSPNTFFIKNEKVYFIVNQTILTAMKPWKS